MSLKNKLSTRDFVVIADMNTPKGVDISELVTHARLLKGRVDAVMIPDMDNGVMRMSALAGGVLMQRQGLEPILHIYGRDRNQMAIQGDLLAAHVLGLHNVLVVQAEAMADCDHPVAREVGDLDEDGIIGAIESLKKGIDLAGFELRGTPDFFSGCTMKPVNDNAGLDAEIEALKARVAKGASYIVAPPVFDMAVCKEMLATLKTLGVPVIASLFLLKNVGMARYLSINDPACRLPESLITRIRKASDRETECVTIAAEMLAELKPVSDGVRLSALGWEDRLPAVLAGAGL